jgi:hypothetical protein
VEAEVVVAAEALVEALLGNASVIGGVAALGLRVVVIVTRLVVAVLLRAMLLLGLGLRVLLLGALILLSLPLLGLARVLVLLGALLGVLLDVLILLLRAFLVLLLGLPLVVVGLMGSLLGSLLFFLRVLLRLRFWLLPLLRMLGLRPLGWPGLLGMFFLFRVLFALEGKQTSGAKGEKCCGSSDYSESFHGCRSDFVGSWKSKIRWVRGLSGCAWKTLHG